MQIWIRTLRAVFGAASLVGTLSLSGAAAPIAAGGTAPSGTATPQTSALQKSLLMQMQDAFTQIAQAVGPTVVNIKAERPVSPASEMDTGGDGSIPAPHGPGKAKAPGQPRRLQATGSGVIVRADGYILTNEHVVDSAVGGLVTVTLSDGREFPGKVYPDYKSDLAIVKIDPGALKLPVAQFAEMEKVVPGQWAIAVGSPFDLQNTITVGIISAVNRHQRINGDGEERYYPDLIQTDAAINPGNSGGPLFNIDGQVVGINVAIESPVDSSAGVGFAIPIKIARLVADALIMQGKVTRGYLGLTPEDLTPAMQAQYGRASGAFVRDLAIGSPADKAGLQASDIITTYEGKPVQSELDLREQIAATPPARKVSIGYIRDNSAAVATATIDPAPALAGDAVAAPSQSALPRQSLGITVRPLTTQDRQSLNLPLSTRGVMITAVSTGSLAEAHGLTPGMVIQKVNARPVTSKWEYEKAVGDLSFPSLTLIVLRPDAATNQLYQHAFTLPI